MSYAVNILKKEMPVMLSAFFLATDMEVYGDYVPECLPKNGMTDRYVVDDENNILYMAEWDEVRPPSFKLWRIDGNKKTHSVSERIQGCCEGMTIKNGQLIVGVFGRQDGELGSYRIAFDFS